MSKRKKIHYVSRTMFYGTACGIDRSKRDIDCSKDPNDVTCKNCQYTDLWTQAKLVAQPPSHTVTTETVEPAGCEVNHEDDPVDEDAADRLLIDYMLHSLARREELAENEERKKIARHITGKPVKAPWWGMVGPKQRVARVVMGVNQ